MPYQPSVLCISRLEVFRFFSLTSSILEVHDAVPWDGSFLTHYTRRLMGLFDLEIYIFLLWEKKIL